jgi:hypothetical protein
MPNWHWDQVTVMACKLLIFKELQKQENGIAFGMV